ncbi:MAG: hypothetical protein IJU21_00145 [Bacteroidales bacterium]|nr:hypothetical protein [Bacteroidales bacterium]
MFKSYILSFLGMLLGVGALVFIYIYRNGLEPENTKYSCAFNSATVESKIIGLKLDDVSEKYLAPISVKKKAGKGNMVAHYEDVKILTRGEKTIVWDMDVTYKDSVATAITLGEPHTNMDARFANASPFSFTLMNLELFTRSKESVNTQKAKPWQVILMVIWLVLMANLPFLLTWPLATLAAKKIEAPWSALVVIPMWLVLYWIYYGIAAYAIGTAMLLLVLGVMWLLIALRAFHKAIRPEPEPQPYQPEDSSNPGSDYNNNADSARFQDYVYHVQNLAVIVTMASYAKNVSEERAKFLTNIAMKEGIGIDLFNKALSSPTMVIHQPSDPSLKDVFIDNFAKILLCDSSFSTVQLGAAITMAEGFGLTDDEFGQRLVSIASSVYHREYSSYKMLKV